MVNPFWIVPKNLSDFFIVGLDKPNSVLIEYAPFRRMQEFEAQCRDCPEDETSVQMESYPMNINITVNVTDQSLASFIKRGIVFADLVARDIAKKAESEKPNKDLNGGEDASPEKQEDTVREPVFCERLDAYHKCIAKYCTSRDPDMGRALQDLYLSDIFIPDHLQYLLDAVGEDHPVYRYAKFVTERDAE